MPNMHVTRSVVIDTPVDKVYPILNDFNRWSSWSPWLIMDPEAKVEVSEDAKSYEWEGKLVGSGNMKILSEDENKSIDYELNFLKPWKSTAKTRFELRPEGDSTKVTWLMDSGMPFFMFFMKKMMEASVGMGYERGLNMLKEYAEKGEVSSQLEFKGEADFPGLKYVGITTTCTIKEVGHAMESDFKVIEAFMKDHQEVANGQAFSIYHKWDLVKNQVKYTSGVGVKDYPASIPGNLITGEIPSCKIYSLRHTGPYRYLGNAWSTMMAMQQGKGKAFFKKNKKQHPFECYANLPGEVAEKELITDVNFAIK